MNNTPPHLLRNAHMFAAQRAYADMQAVAADETLSEHTRLLARQCRDLAAALSRSLKESSHGQSI